VVREKRGPTVRLGVEQSEVKRYVQCIVKLRLCGGGEAQQHSIRVWYPTQHIESSQLVDISISRKRVKRDFSRHPLFPPTQQNG
jgi:hypothetical protein